MEEFSKRGPNRFQWRGTTGSPTATTSSNPSRSNLSTSRLHSLQNLREEPKSIPARVLTNEDLATGKQTDTRPVNTVGSSSKPDAKNSSMAAGPKKGEAYWRGRAKQIRDEIESVDKQIKALNEKTQSGKSDGIKIGFETYNSVIYADFESQVKELERHKEKLQKMMTALEEEARKGGAMPGWLR